MIRRIKIIAISIVIGTCAVYVILYPNYHPHPPHYDSLAKMALRGFLGDCSVYWSEHGEEKICNIHVLTAGENEQNSDVILEGGGNESTFTAIARHLKSQRSFRIQANHEILELAI